MDQSTQLRITLFLRSCRFISSLQSSIVSIIIIIIVIIIITIQLQLYGFNSQLYTNLSVAREFPGGVVGVSIMLQVLFILYYFTIRVILMVITTNFTFFITILLISGVVLGVSIMVQFFSPYNFIIFTIYLALNLTLLNTNFTIIHDHIQHQHDFQDHDHLDDKGEG